jgi:spore germination cell wall hydrolase CwlJ-like protein
MSNALLATMLAIPGILPAEKVKQTLDTQPTYSYIVNDLNDKSRKIGEYTAFQTANIIARTLFAEAREDGEVGLYAVASVIYNRANGKVVNFAKVCGKYGWSKKYKRYVHQFSCWNRMQPNEWLPKNFKVKLPKVVKTGSKAQKIWEKAMEIAAEMMAGSFTPTNNANMYYNPDKCTPDWANQLTKSRMIGKHKFGILKYHSPFY